MIGESRLLSVLSKMVRRSRADAVSVCAHAKTRQVFRFAHEAIHQNLIQEEANIIVKVIQEHRIGLASAQTLDTLSLNRCVKAAQEIAAHCPSRNGLPHLPEKHRIRFLEDYDLETEKTSAGACVATLKRLFHLCKGAGSELAGSLVTGVDEFAVVNSSGVSCYSASTLAGIKLVTLYRQLSGYASGVARRWKDLPIDSLLQQSLKQVLHQQDPISLPVGTYEVILEPEAVADLVTWLSTIAFGAKSVEERMSFLAGRMGDTVCDPQITIVDDGTDPSGLRMPFDFEGVPKQRVVLIDEGKAAGLVYDSHYAQRFNHPSTGHALPPDEVEGPLPLHLAMNPANSSLAQMIRSCQRGLLIPRFHYVNGLLNQRETLMTGLTREGTFLIEDGKMRQPVRTMRFTQGLMEALSQLRAISKERRLIANPSEDLGCAVMPALHLAKFKFTGRSES